VGGNRRYYQLRESYIKDLGMTVGLARDISELGEADEEISRYNSLLNDLLESSTSAVAIFGQDTRLKFYNQAYVRMWGFGETWLDAHPTFSEVLEYLRENRKLPEQANFSAFKKFQLKLFTDLMEPSEEFFYLPDGRTLRNVRIPHAMGGVLFTYEDVTDRLALERSYNTLIAVQRETLDNLHEGIIVFGEDGKIRLSNPVFRVLWGVREADIAAGTHVNTVLESIRSLIRTANWDDFKKEFISQIQSRRLMASRMSRADDKVLDWSMVPLPDGGTLLTYVDVTDSMLVELSLREKNEALQAADRLKSEFLANVSYELRSPLTSISGFADMLRQEYFGALTEKQREYVEGIAQSSGQLIHIISDILDLASIEAGYLALEIKEFDIQKMIQSVLALMVERIKEEQIEVRVEVDDTIGMMRGDETRIRQIMFHLMSNAVKYSPSQTVVTVGARREDDGVYLWVKDQGQGIEPEEQERIFDKFYRGRDGARKSGTGLGLSMVRSFIGLHGGRVVLDSMLGKGTTFTCVIPYNPSAQLPVEDAA
jgi:signal transduction histidine kinase